MLNFQGDLEDLSRRLQDFQSGRLAALDDQVWFLDEVILHQIMSKIYTKMIVTIFIETLGKFFKLGASESDHILLYTNISAYFSIDVLRVVIVFLCKINISELVAFDHFMNEV